MKLAKQITALANAVGRCAMLETTPENVPTRQLSLKKKESQERIQGKRAVSDVDRSERINRGFEKIIEFVSVLGQMNNFVYDRARNIIHKLDAIYNMDENERYSGSLYKGNV